MDSNFNNQGNNNFGGNNPSENPETPNNVNNTSSPDVTGNADYTGSSDAAGNTGYTSNANAAVNTGYTGNADAAVNTGNTGNADANINTGYTGNADVVGNAGYTGNADVAGNASYTGSAGTSGNAGYTNGATTGNYGNYNNYSNPNGYSGVNYQNGANPTGANPNQGQAYSQDNSQYSQYGGNVQNKWNYDDYQKALDQKNKSGEKKINRGVKPFIITVSSILAVAVIGFTTIGIYSLFNRGNNTYGAVPSDQTSSTNLQIDNQPSSSSTATTAGTAMTAVQVSKKLTPAVVGIEIYDVTSSSVEPSAEGSGIVMSSSGYIVTNAHVVSGAQKITVVMSNGKEYSSVKLVGSDTKSDLAVLKINATGLTTAKFGNSAQLEIGQSVIAIGNPGGLTLAGTVTNGIISGLNRTVSSSTTGTPMKYIQTNALINPGNSGGPLVNMYGQVVGINTAKISETGYEGIGFSIPINTVKPVVDSIIANGYVKGRVKLGISVYNLSTTQAQYYSYPSGLYIQTVDQLSDAYVKGLRTKDIITKINGISIASADADTIYNTFYKEETKYKVGQTVTLTVYRPDTEKTLTFTIKLEEDKGDASTSTTSSSTDDGNDYNYNYDSGSDGTSSDSFWGSFGGN